jgi:hypothetical protein
LLYYHGGPGWRQNYGPESAGYVPGVAAKYQRYAAADTKTATDAMPKAAADDPFSKALQEPAQEPAQGSQPAAAPATKAEVPDAFTAALGPKEVASQVQEQDPLSGSYLGGQLPPPTSSGIGRIGQAAVQGFQETPNILTPEAQASLENAGPVGRYISGPLVKVGNQALGAVGALGGAVGQGAYEVGNAVGGPAMGRDLFMLQQVAPAAAMMAPAAPNYLRPPEGPPPPRFVQEYYGEGTLQNPLAAQPALPPPAFVPPGINLPPRPVEAPAFVPPGVSAVGNAVGGALPRGVGAAASREGSAAGTFGLSPKEVTAYRSTAEGQKLLEAQQPGIPDRTAYVPGVEPSAAEIEQSVNTSRELKSLKLQAPEVSEEARAIAAQNNDARRLHFEQLAGSDVSLMNAKAARTAQAEADLKATWAGKTEADPAAVLAKAAEIKASPDGRRPLVRGAIDSVTSELTGPDGKLITDPEQLYGVRKHIDDLTSREAAAADPKNVRAVAALDQLKTELDTVIEASAPGFKQYLKNFSDSSRPIDAAEALQKFEPKLYDAQNRMQYSRVQSMMRQIVDARSAPGINPYKSIPDETMQQLWNLRDDLRRSAGAEELARTTGSDTAQNAWDIAKTYGKLGGTAAAHGVANYISPGFGSMALSGARNMLAPIFNARTARRQTSRGMEMLHPKQNLLEPPP